MDFGFINSLPEQVKAGKLSVKTAIDTLAVIIQNNYKAFGLIGCDEDFRSTIILQFIQKGYFLFDKYKSDCGTFYTYLYSYLRGLILSEKKRIAQTKLSESARNIEMINDYIEMGYEYQEIDYGEFEKQPIPFSVETIDIEKVAKDLRSYMAGRKHFKNEKTAVIIALKSCFYLTDGHLKKLSQLCNVDEDDLHKVILYLKESIDQREERHEQIKQRRNTAYFRYQKYDQRLKSADNLSEAILEEIDHCKKIQENSWELNNEKLKAGLYRLCPTNKNLASVLGICERQVSYYITHAKIQAKELSEKGYARIEDDDSESAV